MGIDPRAAAAQAQAAAVPQGGMMTFSVGMLLTIYLANNWKMVLALQQLVGSMVEPFLSAAAARKAASVAAGEALQLEEARKARLARLKAKTSG